MIWKIFKFVVAATVCLVVAALSTALFYRLYLRHKVAEDRAIHSPQGIDSLESVRIGGIDQWIGLTPDGSPLVMRRVQGSEI